MLKKKVDWLCCLQRSGLYVCIMISFLQDAHPPGLRLHLSRGASRVLRSSHEGRLGQKYDKQHPQHRSDNPGPHHEATRQGREGTKCSTKLTGDSHSSRLLSSVSSSSAAGIPADRVQHPCHRGARQHQPRPGPPGQGAADPRHGASQPDPGRRLQPGGKGALLRPHHGLLHPGETHGRRRQQLVPRQSPVPDSDQGAALPGEGPPPQGQTQGVLRQQAFNKFSLSGAFLSALQWLQNI